MENHSITVHLTPEIETQLAALANERKQDIADVAADVIASYVAVDSQERRHIRAGLAELEAGHGVSNEHVMEWLDSWGTENELPAPR